MDRKEKAQVRDFSKKIKKGIRDNKRSKRHEKALNIVEELQGIKSIANIKTTMKKMLITLLRNEAGDIEATRKAVANTENDITFSKTDVEPLRAAASQITHPLKPLMPLKATVEPFRATESHITFSGSHCRATVEALQAPKKSHSRATPSHSMPLSSHSGLKKKASESQC